MTPFDHIAIIYNPGSSGDAPEIAKALSAKINKLRLPDGLKATLVPTKHAEHAIELAYEAARTYTHPLIISVSGDGGYNEVINGVMRAKNESKKADPVVAVAAAGNANDHRRVMRDRPLVELISENKPRPLDLIKLNASGSDFSLERYAHSYIGFGVTPQIGHELNKHGKSVWHEIKTILHTYRTYAPFKVTRNDTTKTMDNLLFANINEMAKVLQLDDVNTVHDGKFEVLALHHRSKIAMVLTLLKAATVGLKDQPSYSSYEFVVHDALPVQLDGEVVKLPDDCSVRISSVKDAINSLF